MTRSISPRSPDIPRNLDLFGTLAEIRAPKKRHPDHWIDVVANAGVLPEGDPGSEGSPVAGVTPVIKNNWQNIGGTDASLGFYLSPDGEVRFKGHIRGGDVGTTVFVLPVSYRPADDLTFICPTDTGGYAQVQVIASTGEVKVTTVSATVVITS